MFCSSDVLVHGVITEVQARGLNVPGDLALASHIHPSLATVDIDGVAIDRQAACFTIDQIAGVDIGERIRDIGFAIVSRDSV